MKSIKKRLIVLVTAMLCGACATTQKSEDEYLQLINGALAQDRYSLAATKIMDFQKQYPNSKHICRVLPVLIAYKKNSGLKFSESENEYDQKCRK